VQPAPSLSEQFGLHCAVVRHLTRGFPYKVCCAAALHCCCACQQLTHFMCWPTLTCASAIKRPSHLCPGPNYLSIGADCGVQGVPTHQHRQPQGGDRPHSATVLRAGPAGREEPEVCTHQSWMGCSRCLAVCRGASQGCWTAFASSDHCCISQTECMFLAVLLIAAVFRLGHLRYCGPVQGRFLWRL
jgi:hypothetical protein